ncbi:MAG TPA: inorganic diphosphatase [Kofleriaceae bacterium]
MWFSVLWLPCSGAPLRAVVGGAPVSPRAFAIDPETVVGARHYSRGYPAQNPDDSVNAVIEIPTGTTGKFEVDEASGWLRWQHAREGGRRAVDYLAFVVNYGMVPRTLAPDGDALDIVVLGAGIERGHVAATRVIGVLKMGEESERDDKLIAVPVEPALENGFTRLTDLHELDDHYPASRTIIETWFSYYWGAGATNVLGWGDAAEARAILDAARLRAFVRPMRPSARGLHLRAPWPSGGRARSPRQPDRQAARGSAY